MDITADQLYAKIGKLTIIEQYERDRADNLLELMRLITSGELPLDRVSMEGTKVTVHEAYTEPPIPPEPDAPDTLEATEALSLSTG